MKAKLIKKDGHYFLEVEPNTWTPPNRFHSIIANTLEKIKGDILQLSLSNCQAIECGYDLDELTHIRAEILNSYTSGTKWADDIDKLLTRYREVIELMGDKKFSEQDVKNIFAKTLENAPSMESHTRMISDEQYRHSVMDELYDRIIKSLQQTEWDVEVEIEKYGRCELCLKAGFWHCAHADTCGSAVEAERPKLDADGCLILKPLPKE